MENDELLRRAEDLSARCEKNCEVTGTFFLTPAERVQLEAWASYGTDCTVVFSGGRKECERQAAFFLPYYMETDDFKPEEHICCVRAKAGFGEPGHRDYLGAVLGLGIRREWVGDIWIDGGTAYIFCLPSVERHLLASLDKVGRYGVKTQHVELGDVPAPERRVRQVSFTVKSMRLDAVASGLFGLSRTETAKLIESGAASLNYVPCLRTDAPVKGGDVISLRGRGKGTVSGAGGVSRKGRLFVEAEKYE
jgi:RNA-binding protein YlmH